jgi:hypothetical protein
MRFQITFFISILTFTIFLTGCPAPQPPNANVNGTNNAAPNANKSELVPKTKEEAPTTNDAPTIAPVVHAYYDALKKKDDAALRKVLTAEFIKSLEEDMKAEKKKSLAAFVAETEKIPEKQVEVRNEIINGDKASAEIKGGTYINWTKFNFIKENGEWKRTNKFDDFESVKQAASNSTTAK